MATHHPYPVRRHYTPVDGLTLYSESAGAGEPVVLIHGLAGSTRWWSRNVAALAEGHQVHSIDLVGFGKSRGGPFSLRTAAAAIARWMDHTGLGRAAIVGHSMGGVVATELAADYSSRVSALVLVAPALPGVGPHSLPTAGELIRSLPHLPFSFLDLLLPDLLSAGLPTVAGALVDLTRVNLAAKLAQVSAPTLLVWGERDPLVPYRLARPLARALRCRELAVFKGAGHNPMWERPEPFNRLLAEFLAQHASALPRAAGDADAQRLQALEAGEQPLLLAA